MISTTWAMDRHLQEMFFPVAYHKVSL
jgi:hypothetical protein